MSDSESRQLDAEWDMAHEDCMVTMTAFDYENMDNDLYWAKEERDQFKANTAQLEQERDRILAQAASLQVEIDKRNSAAANREKGLRERNAKKQKDAVPRAELIRDAIIRKRIDHLSTTTIQLEIQEEFGIKRSRFFEINSEIEKK